MTLGMIVSRSGVELCKYTTKFDKYDDMNKIENMLKIWVTTRKSRPKAYTRRPKSNGTNKKIEYFPYESSKRADFFTSDTGIYKLYIHKDKSRKTPS